MESEGAVGDAHELNGGVEVGELDIGSMQGV